MPRKIVIPELGESINKVQIAEWMKKEGDNVEQDESLVSIESDKATVEVPAPASGTLTKILKANGEEAQVGDVIAEMNESTSERTGGDREEEPRATEKRRLSSDDDGKEGESHSHEDPENKDKVRKKASKPARKEKKRVMPAAQALIEKHDLTAGAIEGTGPGGRVLKEDVLKHLEVGKSGDESKVAQHKRKEDEKLVRRAKEPQDSQADATRRRPGTDHERADRAEEVIRLSLLRRTVAKRLLAAQHTMAMLTTFNEIDMSAVSALRREIRNRFTDRYGVKLGLMSFFVKAVVAALKEIPQLNAELRGDDLVLLRYYDIGVAIGAGKGLVVPPLRNADQLSFAEIERTIADLAFRAKENRLKPEELEGGTFTISNGGIYGSLLSTPIINPPQSGILGLHAIRDCPVAINGEVVIRPMMNVALSYDHRIVDGREAVIFLRRVKEMVESPSRLLLEA